MMRYSDISCGGIWWDTDTAQHKMCCKIAKMNKWWSVPSLPNTEISTKSPVFFTTEMSCTLLHAAPCLHIQICWLIVQGREDASLQFTSTPVPVRGASTLDWISESVRRLIWPLRTWQPSCFLVFSHSVVPSFSKKDQKDTTNDPSTYQLLTQSFWLPI